MSSEIGANARAVGRGELANVLQSLEGRRASILSSHGGQCCDVAGGWFRSMARAAANEFDPHPWPVASRWPWGPTRWPLYWCEAVIAKELDCGALAALSAVALSEAGRETLRVQLLQRFSREFTEHWERRWRATPDSQPWIWGDLAYHEVVGLKAGESLRLWNPTESCWITASAQPQTGRILAMRVLPNEGAGNAPREIYWEGNGIPLGQWAPLS